MAQALFHFVTDLARVFTDHSESWSSDFLPSKSIVELCEQIRQRALPLFQASGGFSGNRLCTVCWRLLERRHLTLLIRGISQHIFRHDLPYHSSKQLSSFQRICVSLSSDVVRQLPWSSFSNNSALDLTGCGSTFASLCVLPRCICADNGVGSSRLFSFLLNCPH